MKTRTMELTDADTLARRIREGSLTTGGTDDDLRWDKDALQKHLGLCAAGAGLGILGAVAIALWFRFGTALERPIEIALSAISIGLLVLTGVAVLNAIGPVLLVFARERLGRVFMEEKLATSESNENTWRDIALSSAMLVSNAVSPVRPHDESVAALLHGVVDRDRYTSRPLHLDVRQLAEGRHRMWTRPAFDIELLRRHCRGVSGSPFCDLTVAVFETNPRRAVREIRERLEALERALSPAELIEVDAKLKYAILLLDPHQDEEAG